MGRKVFEYEPPKDSQTPEFEVAGEVFHCQPTAEVSSLDVLDYVAGMTGESGVGRIQSMLRLYNTFIAEGDAERFRKTVKAKQVPLTTLSEIASWVLDEYLRFPTQGDGQSSNGSTPDVQPSEAVSSPPPDAT